MKSSIDELITGEKILKKLNAEEYKRFEDIKSVREDGSEYWSARELAIALDYTQWRNFLNVINRAMIACENSGHSILDDFAEVSKIVDAGVITNEEFAIFQNAGYIGLYGGLNVDDIHARKGLEVGQKILDYMGSTELIANLFRISQTEEKLRKDQINGADKATAVHYSVGKEVRTAIEKIGGTMPEDLPTPEKSIQQIEKERMARLKAKAKTGKLMLDE